MSITFELDAIYLAGFLLGFSAGALSMALLTTFLNRRRRDLK